MADIRIKDLATTASTTASDDFMAVDGTTNGTRKLSAATPSFATSVTVPGVSGPTATNLTLAGGSTGASLVLGQGTNASTVFTGTGTGLLSFTKTTGNPEIRAIAPAGGAGVFRAYTPSTSTLSVYGIYSVLEGNGNKWENGFYGTLDYVHRYNDAEKWRFTTTGNLLIGGTTDITGTGGLKVAGTSTAFSTTSGALQVGSNVGLSGNAGGASYFGGAVTAAGDITRSGASNSIITASTSGTSAHGKFNTVADVAQATLRTEGSLTSGTLFSTNRASATQLYSESGPLVLGAFGAFSAVIGTNNTARLTIDSAGAATFTGAVSSGTTSTSGTQFDASATGASSSSGGAFIRVGVRDGAALASGDRLGGVLFNGSTGASTDENSVAIFGYANDTWSAGVAPGRLDIDIAPAGSATRVNQLRLTATTATFAGAVTVSSSTASTNTTSGALVVTGGVGVGGAINVGGVISTSGTGFSAINASGSVEFIGSRSSTGAGSTVTYKTGATTNWFHGLRGLVDNNWYLFNNGTATNTLIFDYGTNAATFAGAVAIGNTVNTVSPTSPNRTVTMVIGGVTYYLAAKTTND